MPVDETTETEEVETEEVEAPEAETEAEEPDESGDFDAVKAREKIRKVNSENRNLRKRATDAEAKAQGADENGKKVPALEAENLRLRIGLKHGLHSDLIDRLKGSTEEELLEDAEKLLDLFGGKKPPTQQPREKLRGGGDPTQTTSEIDDLDKFAEKVFRN